MGLRVNVDYCTATSGQRVKKMACQIEFLYSGSSSAAWSSSEGCRPALPFYLRLQDALQDALQEHGAMQRNATTALMLFQSLELPNGCDFATARGQF